jgi:hypothetical protein
MLQERQNAFDETSNQRRDVQLSAYPHGFIGCRRPSSENRPLASVCTPYVKGGFQKSSNV